MDINRKTEQFEKDLSAVKPRKFNLYAFIFSSMYFLFVLKSFSYFLLFLSLPWLFLILFFWIFPRIDYVFYCGIFVSHIAAGIIADKALIGYKRQYIQKVAKNKIKLCRKTRIWIYLSLLTGCCIALYGYYIWQLRNNDILNQLSISQQNNAKAAAGFIHKHTVIYAEICENEGYNLDKYPTIFNDYFAADIRRLEDFLHSRGSSCARRHAA